MKNLASVLLALLMGFGLRASEPEAGYSLTVIVKNIKTTDGKIGVAYYDNKHDFLEKGEIRVVDIEEDKVVKVVFEDIRASAVAVSVIHDENANGALDTGIFGIPTEPYGFSNDARGKFGPPSFKDCLVKIEGNKTIEINLN